MRSAKPGSMFALLVVLPVGTALSGVLTWSLFGNLYGGLVFVGLFVVGVAAENSRQTRIKARRLQADAESEKYVSQLLDAVREAGVDVGTPAPDV